MEEQIKFQNVVKSYEIGNVKFKALDGVSFSIPILVKTS